MALEPLSRFDRRLLATTMFDPDTQAIYDEILGVAQNRELTYYGDVAPLVGLDMDNPGDRDRISDMLGAISKAEHRERRPLLTAVVVLRGKNIPGQGFFNLSECLGLYNGSTDELAKLEYWIEQVHRVHEYWGR